MTTDMDVYTHTTVTGYDGTPRVAAGGTYETGIRVKYAFPTNSRGSRFIVTNLRTGERKTISYNYAANSPARDAAGKAFDVQPDDISWIGETHDANYFVARLPLPD